MFTLDAICFGNTIPHQITSIISLLINFIKVGVPLLLIIFGMLDLGKAVIAQKEDDIKKGQNTFIKRIIAAAIVFFVVVIVQVVIQLVGGDNGAEIWQCVNDLITGA